MSEVLVAKEGDLRAAGRKVIAVKGVEIGLFVVDSDIFAWLNHCPHQGGPACQGRLMKPVEERLDNEKKSLGIHYKDCGGLNIVCPWHGFEFDVRTGKFFGAGDMKLKGFPVSVRNGDVYVTL
jgi:nitrite reductase/ring-hydroxylating ferredoxin subunit